MIVASVAATGACGSDADSVDQAAGVPIELEEPAELTIGVVEGNPVEIFHELGAPSRMDDGR